MPDLSTHEVAALRFMKKNPIRVDPFSPVANVEAVVEMLDALAKMGLCRRTLQGLSRVYSITPEGLEALSKEAAEGDDQL
jgi:predicted transcriptional regulator